MYYIRVAGFAWDIPYLNRLSDFELGKKNPISLSDFYLIATK